MTSATHIDAALGDDDGADGEAVAGVQVGHADGALHAGHGRDGLELLDRGLVDGRLVADDAIDALAGGQTRVAARRDRSSADKVFAAGVEGTMESAATKSGRPSDAKRRTGFDERPLSLFLAAVSSAASVKGVDRTALAFSFCWALLTSVRMSLPIVARVARPSGRNDAR